MRSNFTVKYCQIYDFGVYQLLLTIIIYSQKQ